MKMYRGLMRRLSALTLLACSASGAFAEDFVGDVDQIEAWPGGNVAFTITATNANLPCNGQFILNKSADGTRNLYALLLTAKSTDRQVRISHTTCGPAEGYGGNYAVVNYLYLL